MNCMFSIRMTLGIILIGLVGIGKAENFFDIQGADLLRSYVGGSDPQERPLRDTIEWYKHTLFVEIDNAMAAKARDLNIYIGHPDHPQNSLCTHLGSVATTFGELERALMLAQPLSTQAELLDRQNAIKTLEDNTLLAAQADAILEAVRAGQTALLAYAHRIPADQVVSHDTFYFKGSITRSLNKKAWIMQAVVLGNYLKKVAFITLPLTVATAVNAYAKGNLKEDIFKRIWDSFAQACVTWKEALNPLAYYRDMKDRVFNYDHYKNKEFPEIERYFKSYNLKLEREANGPSFYVKRGIGFAVGQSLSALPLFFFGRAVKHSINDFLNNAHSVMQQQEQLIAIANIVRAYDDLCDLMYAYPALQELHKGIEFIPSKECHTLLDMLRTATFEGHASFFSHTGRVLAAHILLTQCIDEFVPMVRVLGRLDVYRSVNRLMKRLSSFDVHYCFVDYVATEQPTVTLNHLWNPFLDPAVAVTNSLSLGKDHPRALIITGSNTGGKSTFLKGVALALHLADTLTIVPAHQASLSVFPLQGVAFNLIDDLTAGLSHFKAEALRAQRLMELANQATPSAPACIIVDELFSGTSALQATTIARQWLSDIAKNPYVTLITVTHLHELTHLAYSQPDLFINMRMDAKRNADGTINRSFVLESGVSQVHIAQDIVQENA